VIGRAWGWLMADRTAVDGQEDRLRSAPAVWAPRTYAVFEVKLPPEPYRNRPGYSAWAWCELNATGPGFSQTSYTHLDGTTFIEAPTCSACEGRSWVPTRDAKGELPKGAVPSDRRARCTQCHGSGFGSPGVLGRFMFTITGS
jgi:hypothetical protein